MLPQFYLYSIYSNKTAETKASHLSQFRYQTKSSGNLIMVLSFIGDFAEICYLDSYCCIKIKKRTVYGQKNQDYVIYLLVNCQSTVTLMAT